MRNCIFDRLYRAHAVAAEVEDELVIAHLLYGFRHLRWPWRSHRPMLNALGRAFRCGVVFRRVTRKIYKGDSGSCLVTRPAVT